MKNVKICIHTEKSCKSNCNIQKIMNYELTVKITFIHYPLTILKIKHQNTFRILKSCGIMHTILQWDLPNMFDNCFVHAKTQLVCVNSTTRYIFGTHKHVHIKLSFHYNISFFFHTHVLILYHCIDQSSILVELLM